MKEACVNICDTGSGFKTEMVAKPRVCASCLKDDDPLEEFLCFLCRVDQQDQSDFRCTYYENRDA